MKNAIVVVLVGALIGVAAPSPAIGQAGRLGESWTVEHREVVTRIIRLWLANPSDPDDPELERALARFLQIETNLMVSRTESPLYIPRLNPDVPVPPQLLELYLHERGVRIAPKDLLVGRAFVVNERLDPELDDGKE